MISLHRLNGEEIFVNVDHIRWIEAKPDTLLVFTDDRTLTVRESTHEVCRLVAHCKAARQGNIQQGQAAWMQAQLSESS